MRNNCGHYSDNETRSDSGFMAGMIFGAVIAAIVAIVIYKNKDSEVISQFKKKINDFLNNAVTDEKKSKKKVIAVANKSFSKVKKAVHLPKKFFKKDQ